MWARLHEPALRDETLELLAVRPGGFWVDGTVGAGGHAAEILRRSAPDGRLFAADRDAEALAEAAQTLAPFGERATLLQADYRELPGLLEEPPDGILLDLGVSSLQLDRAERGFSFKSDGPLDMRMDQRGGRTAADVVNRLPEPELADIIYRYGEERAARRIARRIVEGRRRSPFRTTLQLADVVRSVARRPRGRGIDPATLTFQALRIYVNRELEGLGHALDRLARRLAPRGRLAVIAFHSLEDREVKQAFRSLATAGFRLLTRKPVRPGEDEVRRNPRSRSARLRAVEREAA
jgi:16S rRNA (cytosine1402-N4)-methyltransferase